MKQELPVLQDVMLEERPKRARFLHGLRARKELLYTECVATYEGVRQTVESVLGPVDAGEERCARAISAARWRILRGVAVECQVMAAAAAVDVEKRQEQGILRLLELAEQVKTRRLDLGRLAQYEVLLTGAYLRLLRAFAAKAPVAGEPALEERVTRVAERLAKPAWWRQCLVVLMRVLRVWWQRKRG